MAMAEINIDKRALKRAYDKGMTQGRLAERNEIIKALKACNWYHITNGALIPGAAEETTALVKWCDIEYLIDKLEGGNEE